MASLPLLAHCSLFQCLGQSLWFFLNLPFGVPRVTYLFFSLLFLCDPLRRCHPPQGSNMSPLISSTSVFPSQTYLLKFGSIYLASYWTFPLGMSYSHLTFTEFRLTTVYHPYMSSFLCSLPHLVLASAHQSQSRKFSLILTVISHSIVVDSVT